MKRFAQFFLLLAVFSFAIAASAITEAPPRLQPPHDELGPTFWEARGRVLVLGNIAFFLLIGALFLLLRHPGKVIVEAPDAAARRLLESLRNRPEDPQLLAQVSRILRGYMVFAFCLPPDEFTTTELKFELQARPSADARLASELIEFLQQCDKRKFAPEPSSISSGTVARALELLEKIVAHHGPTAVPPVLEPGTASPTPA